MTESFDYDFYGIMLRMRLQKSSGVNTVLVEKPLQLETDATLSKIYKYLSQLIVDIGIGYEQKISVTLEPTYEDGIALIDSPWLARGNILYVQWGYTKNNQLSPWFSGIIYEQPDVDIGQEFSITLNARGFGYVAARTRNANPLSGTCKEIATN